MGRRHRCRPETARSLLFRSPESGADGDEHWDLVKDASIRYDTRFVPIYDSILFKGFRWTSFELIRGESLGARYFAAKGCPQPALNRPRSWLKSHDPPTKIPLRPTHRRPWICPENVWIDGNRVSIAPGLPVPPAYAEIGDDIEALAFLLLHCLNGTYNSRSLDNFATLRELPQGMRKVLERCSKRRENDRFESAKELSIALMSFQWATATQADNTSHELDREELLATLHVVTPRRSTIWNRLFGRRAA